MISSADAKASLDCLNGIIADPEARANLEKSMLAVSYHGSLETMRDALRWQLLANALRDGEEAIRNQSIYASIALST